MNATAAAKRPAVQLSTVIPVYNEEESLPALHKRLTKVLSNITDDYEIVLVDDGSRDRSAEIIESLAAQDPHVVGILLSRNFGHQIALTAGLDHARGDAIAMMDADLQDPPELLPRMLKRIAEGYDVVYAQRRKRAGESPFKLFTAALFYRLLRSLTKVDIPLDTGDFRVINRVALDSVLSLRERNRFLRGMFSWVGFRQTGVLYNRAARHAGETKYPLKKMVRLAIDGITSFSHLPLQFATWLGFTFALLGAAYGMRVLYVWSLGGAVQGWASTVLTVLVLGGVQLVTLGIIGEYVGRILDESRRRPLYFVRRVAHRDAPPAPAPPAASLVGDLDEDDEEDPSP
ncbi:MAG: glycosyltransferase family 2 protein [Candidatus Sumerlaeia bacterium]|nr:glycosyltransferase family 2 protein [Candidatus Sumerlaeia bacterium]